jgi:hypothetical protein
VRIINFSLYKLKCFRCKSFCKHTHQ